jgi:pimeloyl-ACP methyl ester carboxylesterase
MPKIRTNGLEMYYELDETGTPVVLISGLTGDHTAWAPQLPDLRAAGYRCLQFDNRDVGQTRESPTGYTIREFAADTVGLMDALDVPSAHIIGASMGGMIAQEIGLNYPGRVLSLTLVCTMASTAGPLADILRAWKAARPPASPAQFTLTISPWLFTYRFYEQPEPMQGLLQMVRDNPFPQTPAGFARQCDAILSHDAAGRLGSVRAPTHVIVGTEDTLTPRRYSHALAALIPGARLTEIGAAGHGVFWEKVPEFNLAVTGFLNEQQA